MAWTKDIRGALVFIRAGGGHSVTTLIAGDGMFNGKWNVLHDLLNYCPNATSLKICEKATVWITRFGGQLESLEVCTGYAGLQAVANTVLYCASIRSILAPERTGE